MSKFDDILKVDLSNKLQFKQMYECFHRSIEVVCCWMNDTVFPSETYQYSANRATSAWNLVDPNTVGFSGTDDNRFLLPLAVHQEPQNREE